MRGSAVSRAALVMPCAVCMALITELAIAKVKPLCLNSRSMESVHGSQACLRADELSCVRRTEPPARNSTVKGTPRSGPINRGSAAPDSWVANSSSGCLRGARV